MEMTQNIAVIILLLGASVALADVEDIGPTTSTLDSISANGASGGRINGLSVDPTDSLTFYAASEWGGLWKSTNGGQGWELLDGHVPTATWDVAVDPSNASRVIATSFYDGRIQSQSGISVSLDAGATWFKPASTIPNPGFCLTAARRAEPSAFGISFDAANSQNIYVGTNCGLAISNDSGLNWRFVDPTPANLADDVWDVIVHNGGIIDLCGLDGHQRSVDGGATWTTAAGFPRPPGGRCSIDISPDESYVVFVVSGITIWESDDGGATWPNTITNPAPQGRIPFVAVNDRNPGAFDLWFGDQQLFRARCSTPSAPAMGGTARCPSNTWINAQNGAHWDAGDIVFNPQTGANACPLLYSNDGGIYLETQGTSPACHTPSWEQPLATPRALWHWDLEGANTGNAGSDDLYFGAQDNGLFATSTIADDPTNWTNQDCCDGFDVAAESGQVVNTFCCATTGRATLVDVRNAGMVGGSRLTAADYPPGNVLSFNLLDTLENFGVNSYAIIMTTGVYVTQNINVIPGVNWVQLGAASTPPAPCGIQSATAGGNATFFVKSGGCDGDAPGSLWRYAGTNANGTWQQITRNGVSRFGIYAVDPTNRLRIFASDLATPGAPQMVMTSDGGTTWQPLPALDNLMTAGGLFQYQNQRGQWVSAGLFQGYPQPSLVGYDPENSNIMIAGAADAGVFLSIDAGINWELVTDPLNPASSGTPHIPRPHDAHFVHEPSGQISVYIGTIGRGAWKLSFEDPDLLNGFEYPVPVVCGLEQGNLFGSRIINGRYESVVTIHNPNIKDIEFVKKLALTYPSDPRQPTLQVAGDVLPIAVDELGPGEALELDCLDIAREAFGGELPLWIISRHITGVVLIQSEVELNVAAIYTGAADLSQSSIPNASPDNSTFSLNPQGLLLSSMDIEQFEPRKIKFKFPDDRTTLPDLLPVAPFPPADTSNLGLLPQNFCLRIQPADSASSADTVRVIVQNIGNAEAAPSTLTVEFSENAGSSSEQIDSLASGSSLSVDFAIPDLCFTGLAVGSSNCSFRIIVDSNAPEDVIESNETNNTVDSVCPGVAG